MKLRHILAATAVSAALLMPSAAWAAGSITKTYAAGEAVPAQVTVDGVTYTLSDTATESSSQGTSSAALSAQKTLSIPASDYNGDAASYFPQTTDITQDGYSATLALASAKADQEATASTSRTVTQTVVFSALWPDEVEAIPSSRTADVEGHGSVKFSKGAVSLADAEDGTGRQRASVEYNATVTDTTPTSYLLTATYGGTGTRQDVAVSSITATYVADAPATYVDRQQQSDQAKEISYISLDAQQGTAAQAKEGDDRAVNGVLLAVGAAIALCALGAGAVIWRRAKAARADVQWDGAEDETDPGDAAPTAE